jgi:hypothetical protein
MSFPPFPAIISSVHSTLTANVITPRNVEVKLAILKLNYETDTVYGKVGGTSATPENIINKGTDAIFRQVFY